MRFVVFGLSISSSWGNGHATIWRGLSRALEQAGHELVFFERDVPYYAANRDLCEVPGAELHLYSTWEAIRETAEQEVADADVGMVTSFCPDGVAATDLVLAADTLRVFYDLDTPVTFDMLEQVGAVPYLGPRGLTDFDLVLSYTGGAALEALRARLGARRVAPLYGSVDPELHRPLPIEPRLVSDLSYLGTYAADRQATLEMLFLAPARRLPQCRFLMAGSQYPPDFPWAENVWYLSHLAPWQHSSFYSSSALTLNVTRGAMARMGHCPSGRLFEAAACGVPILSDSWPGMEEFFAPGREIFVARSTSEAVEIICSSPDERAGVARAARERTLAEHTAAARVQRLVSLCEAARSGFRATEPAALSEER
jgi:spore maturation protein CgeB